MKAVHLRSAVVLAVGVAIALVEADRSVGMGTPITTIEVGGRFVVVAVTSAGVRYSVATRDGRWLGAHFSDDELQANFPAISEHIRSSIARSLPPGEFIWAGQ